VGVGVELELSDRGSGSESEGYTEKMEGLGIRLIGEGELCGVMARRLPFDLPDFFLRLVWRRLSGEVEGPGTW
jgi:hypothetical protein